MHSKKETPLGGRGRGTLSFYFHFSNFNYYYFVFTVLLFIHTLWWRASPMYIQCKMQCIMSVILLHPSKISHYTVRSFPNYPILPSTQSSLVRFRSVILVCVGANNGIQLQQYGIRVIITDCDVTKSLFRSVTLGIHPRPQPASQPTSPSLSRRCGHFGVPSMITSDRLMSEQNMCHTPPNLWQFGDNSVRTQVSAAALTFQFHVPSSGYQNRLNNSFCCN